MLSLASKKRSIPYKSLSSSRVYSIVAQRLERLTSRCTGGHGFDSRRGFKFFSLSHVRDMLNIIFFFFSSPSLNFTIFLSLSPYMVLSTLLIIVVCSTHVIINLARYQSPNSSNVSASDQCAKSHVGSTPVGDLKFLFEGPCSLKIEF